MLQKSSFLPIAVSLWQRFVTVHEEDQNMLVEEGRKWSFRPIVSNYQGNSQAVITHQRGDARQYERHVALQACHAQTSCIWHYHITFKCVAPAL